MNLPDNVLAHWENFAKLDIPAAAPFEQRHEMQRAFLAGVSSGIVFGLNVAKAANGDYATTARQLANLMDEVSAADGARCAAFNARLKTDAENKVP